LSSFAAGGGPASAFAVVFAFALALAFAFALALALAFALLALAFLVVILAAGGGPAFAFAVVFALAKARNPLIQLDFFLPSFIFAFSAQKSHVKPQSHLTHLPSNGYSWNLVPPNPLYWI
jgi:hypothetical protein